MATENWPAVRSLAQTALLHSGDAPEVVRKVGELKNVILRSAARAGAGSRLVDDPERYGQVQELEAMLRRSRARILPDRGDVPTEETAARARVDVVLELLEAGVLLPAHADAAHEIREVFMAVTKGLWPKAGMVTREKLIGRTARRRFVDPIAQLDPAMRRLWSSRYRPWADEMSRQWIWRGNTGGMTTLALFVAVVVDCRTLEEVGLFEGIGRERAVEVLEAALDRYARMAGWIK